MKEFAEKTHPEKFTVGQCKEQPNPSEDCKIILKKEICEKTGKVDDDDNKEKSCGNPFETNADLATLLKNIKCKQSNQMKQECDDTLAAIRQVEIDKLRDEFEIQTPDDLTPTEEAAMVKECIGEFNQVEEEDIFQIDQRQADLGRDFWSANIDSPVDIVSLDAAKAKQCKYWIY